MTRSHVHQLSTSSDVLLQRTVRFCVEFDGGYERDTPAVVNGYAGFPAMQRAGAFYEFHVKCQGPTDTQTGYVLNIQEIDQAVRQDVLPWLAESFEEGRRDPAKLIRQIFEHLKTRLDSLRELTWQLTPYHGLTVQLPESKHVFVTQHFEFSASHVLHVPSLSAEENRRIFGKCSNPLGHGHNYRLGVGVAVEPDSDRPFSISQLEEVVLSTIIRPFDHKHLNLEVDQFRTLNPTVENITRVCFELLSEPVAAIGGTLAHVTVWETEKTCCTYPASAITRP